MFGYFASNEAMTLPTRSFSISLCGDFQKRMVTGCATAGAAVAAGAVVGGAAGAVVGAAAAGAVVAAAGGRVGAGAGGVVGAAAAGALVGAAAGAPPHAASNDPATSPLPRASERRRKSRRVTRGD